MIIIYIYQNKINNKIYVGQTKNINKRKSQHKAKILNKEYRHPLYDSIRKNGLDNFNFLELEQIEDIDADSAERFWIQFFRSWDRNFGYNIELGGCKNKTVSEETRKKISKANKGRCHNSKEHMDRLHKETSKRRLGTHLSTETKNKISKARKGSKHSDNSRRKMSETRIKNGTFAGKNNPNFGKVGELNSSAKLNWEIVNNIREDYNQGLKGKKLMEKYSISETNMYRIIKNKTWKI
jgi:group I intron endonuclease